MEPHCGRCGARPCPACAPSVAIIPMAQDFVSLRCAAGRCASREPRQPPPVAAGLVQSSFFYGYLLSQIPGGYAASLLGGRTVLPAGVFVWSGERQGWRGGVPGA